MGWIFAGGLLGCAVGIAIFFAYSLINDFMSKNYEKVGASLMIAGFIAGMLVGYNVEVHRIGSYIDQYTVAKTTIEQSIHNDQLSGFEKIELVKQATEENKELAAKQYDARQWYGFAIPDEILELEPISIE